MVPDVSYNCKLQLQPHQGTLCCIVSVGLLLFLNRKREGQTATLSRVEVATAPHRGVFPPTDIRMIKINALEASAMRANGLSLCVGPKTKYIYRSFGTQPSFRVLILDIY
jgi:hypothetical protein